MTFDVLWVFFWMLCMYNNHQKSSDNLISSRKCRFQDICYDLYDLTVIQIIVLLIRRRTFAHHGVVCVLS